MTPATTLLTIINTRVANVHPMRAAKLGIGHLNKIL